MPVAVLTPEELEELVCRAVRRVLEERPVNDSATEDMLSTEQAAAALGVKPKTVAGWIRSGRLPASRPGGRQWRIARADLTACSRTAGSAVDPKDAAREMLATLRR
jgi:excisionase family DNA binding protein